MNQRPLLLTIICTLALSEDFIAKLQIVNGQQNIVMVIECMIVTINKNIFS